MKVAICNDWIAELPDEVRREVNARKSVLHVGAGGVITQAQQPANHVFQLVSGYVKLLQNLRDGRQLFLGVYIPGNCFCESPAIANRNYRHSTVALTEVILNAWPRRDFDDLFYKYPQIPQALCRKFAGLISGSLDIRESAALLPISKQVVSVILELTEFCTSSASAPWILEVPLTVSDIAEFLSVSRQTVQKEISSLKQQKLIKKSRGKWIVEKEELQQLLEN
jgi:CRP/FNR family cyclic AMP-dependent transcriptional regulator